MQERIFVAISFIGAFAILFTIVFTPIQIKWAAKIKDNDGIVKSAKPLWATISFIAAASFGALGTLLVIITILVNLPLSNIWVIGLLLFAFLVLISQAITMIVIVLDLHGAVLRSKEAHDSSTQL